MLASFLKRLGLAQHATPALDRAVALYREGRYDECAAACESRLSEVRDAQGLQTLAAARLAQGRTVEGLAKLREAAALAPRNAGVHATIGQVCAAVGDIGAAITSYRTASQLAPAAAAPADALVGLLMANGEYDEAEDRCRASLAHVGESAVRRHTLAKALFEQGYVDAAIAELDAVVAAGTSTPEMHSDLLRAMNYSDAFGPAATFDAHAAWGKRYADPLTAAAPPLTNPRDPDRRLRVGYVSPYFRKHAVTFFLESVIEHHDYAAYDVVLYADVQQPDDYSQRLQAHGARWRSIVGTSDEALAELARSDGVDILVDLSGHTGGNRLLAFARRAAPVQVTWNGYPNTTGMRAMDYRISDSLADPPGESDALHSERVVRLGEVFMSWKPPSDAPASQRRPPTSDALTFGSFNACYKLTPTTIALWARVLHAVAESSLVFFAVPAGRAEARLRSGFGEHGIDAQRLQFRRRMSHEDFLEAHGEIDVALDPYPYHGTTTTCFSLWMGVPVLALAGPTTASRIGASLLPAAGFPHLVAATPEEFVSIAAGLARDPAALATFRKNARERMLVAPLTDGAACARALEQAFRSMWRAWCVA